MGDIWDKLEKRAKIEWEARNLYMHILKKRYCKNPILIKDGVTYWDGDTVLCKNIFRGINKKHCVNRYGLSCILHRNRKQQLYVTIVIDNIKHNIKISKKNIVQKIFLTESTTNIYQKENKMSDNQDNITDRVVELFKHIQEYTDKHPSTGKWNNSEDLLIMNNAKNIINYLMKKPVFTIAGVFFYEGDKIRLILSGTIKDGVLSYEPNDSSYYLKLNSGEKQSIAEYTRLVNLDRESLCEDKNGVPLLYGDRVISKSISLFGEPLTGTVDIDAYGKVYIAIVHDGIKMSMHTDYEFKYECIEKLEDK